MMLSRTLVSLAVASAVFTALPAAAQRNGTPFGISLGAYFPTDQFIRDSFGSTWFSIGIQPLKFDQGRLISTDLAITTRTGSGNKVALVRPTIGFSKAFGDAEASSRPYAAIRVGPMYADYSITRGAQRFSHKRIGLTGNAEIGMLFRSQLSVSARYDVMSRFDGFNFNGFSLNVSYKIGSF